jgi:hypothetical protein
MAKAKMPHLGHAKHLCYLVNVEYHKSNLRDYKVLVKNARFICKRCGLVANRSMNLCKPVKL